MTEQGSAGQPAPVSGLARSLPPDLMIELRQAYREEAAERLTALERALAEPVAPSEARRAAHALGSSAWVAGEREVSALARDVESRIDTRRPWADQAVALVAMLRADGVA